MLRITQFETSVTGPTIKLEGKLLRAWVSEVRAAVAGAMASGRPARLDLSALSYVDADGARALDSLLQGGVELSDCSPFVATLLHREAAL
jgi:anti-anti-sigma regulatory factor